MQGKILVNDQKVQKAGTPTKDDAYIRVLGDTCPYVSRAGLKLESAWRHFQFDIEDKTALDIGLSTGGFTDFLKQHGAKAVFGVDVGYGIVDFTLRQWDKLILLERTNARLLTHTNLKAAADLAGLPGYEDDISLVVMDVSFISVLTILPALLECLNDGTDFVIMIKPQFEAEEHEVEPGGVVSDPETRQEIVTRTRDAISRLGLEVLDMKESDVSGQKKRNIETFLWARKATS
jgi:23S rRNA (cytidine1920-2'-O)/16S rRNA (cytidine1409-2'-O)-methyltransferase